MKKTYFVFQEEPWEQLWILMESLFWFLPRRVGAVDSPGENEGEDSFLTLFSPLNFAAWYRDVADINQKFVIPLTFTETGNLTGVFEYQNSAYFPIDNLGFG